MSGYALPPEAFTDLDDIWEFIATGNINAADRVIADIFDAMRAKRVWDYRIAYAPDASPLWVIAVMHGHHSPRVMARIPGAENKRPGEPIVKLDPLSQAR